jgi:hypothetical protein
MLYDCHGFRVMQSNRAGRGLRHAGLTVSIGHLDATTDALTATGDIQAQVALLKTSFPAHS